jgi:hypothetical protein
VLRIFEPKREEVAGAWRRLHNEELHKLYISSNVIRVIKSRKMKWAGYIALRDTRNVPKILVRTSEGKRPLGRPRHRWEDSIRINLREIWWEGMEWICLTQYRDLWWVLVNMVMNNWIP